VQITVSSRATDVQKKGCHGQEAGVIQLLTSSFNHVVDEPVVTVYDYFQPEG
jgi:hypothetical protein